MTLVVNAKDDRVVDQIIKQLDKLVDVIQVIDFREGESVEREMVLLQIEVTSRTRAEVIELCDIFRAKIIDVSPTVLTIEVTGDTGKVDKFVLLMTNFGIKDLTRTGKIALPRAEGLQRPIVST
jgi:acetolactate synthase-1/3 small subunit